MTTTELTDKQRHDRRKMAARAITKALRETHHEWHTLNDGDWRLLGDIAVDALGDAAAEIISDGTMLRAFTVRDGVATLDLEPSTEILKIFVAGMRGVLDGYGAENYVETEMTAPSVSMDVASGDNPRDSYTVTIQRRTGTTPHQFRQRAERERDGILRLVADWYASSEGREVLYDDLTGAGYTLPEADR